MTFRDVAVVGFAHAPHVRRTEGTTNGVEMLMPCFASVYQQLGIEQTDIGFWCSGSADYLAGRAFSFISASLSQFSTNGTHSGHFSATFGKRLRQSGNNFNSR